MGIGWVRPENTSGLVKSQQVILARITHKTIWRRRGHIIRRTHGYSNKAVSADEYSQVRDLTAKSEARGAIWSSKTHAEREASKNLSCAAGNITK